MKIKKYLIVILVLLFLTPFIIYFVFFYDLERTITPNVPIKKLAVFTPNKTIIRGGEKTQITAKMPLFFWLVGHIEHDGRGWVKEVGYDDDGNAWLGDSGYVPPMSFDFDFFDLYFDSEIILGPEIEKIVISAVGAPNNGSTIVESLQADSLDFYYEGLKNKQAAQFDFNVKELIFNMGEYSDAELEVNAEEVQIFSNYNIKLNVAGKTNDLNISFPGGVLVNNAKINAEDLVAENVTVRTDPGDEFKVQVTNSLSGTIASKSILYYKGNPNTQDISLIGEGKDKGKIEHIE